MRDSLATPSAQKSLLQGLKQTVAQVVVDGKPNGSAFLVDSNHVATALHVLDGVSEVVLRFMAVSGSQAVSYGAKVVWQHLEVDLAVLKLDRVCAIPVLPWAREVREGERWLTFGFPTGVPGGHSLDQGKLVDAHKRVPGLSSTVLQLRVSEARERLSGFSGAPCVIEGAVVGVLTNQLTRRSNVAKPQVGGAERVPSFETVFALPIGLLRACAAVRPTLHEPSGSFNRLTRRFARTAGLTLLSLGTISALSLGFGHSASSERSDPCNFEGHAQSIEIEGSGEATLTRRDAFSGNDVERVDLIRFKLKWNNETRWSEGMHAFARPENLVPTNFSDGPFEVRYEFGTTVQVVLERGGGPGLLQGGHPIETGSMRFDPSHEYRLISSGRRAIRLKRRLHPNTWLAGSFSGVQRLELGDASGTLSCRGQVQDADLRWHSGAHYVDEVWLTPQGFALTAEGTTTPAVKQPRGWRWWAIWSLLALALTFLLWRKALGKRSSLELNE